MSNRKHIVLMCFIADPFDPIGTNRAGGGHIYLLDLARFLVQQGYNVSFVTRKNHPNKPDQDQLGSYFTIYRIECEEKAEISPDIVGHSLECLKVKTFLLFEKLSPIHIIHSHYWISGMIASLYCDNNSIRHIHTVLSIGKIKQSLGEPISDIDEFRNNCEEKIYRSANALLLTCPNEKSNFIRFYPNVDRNKLYVIPNGINTNIFYPREITSNNYFSEASNRFKDSIRR